ncbi:MAG TPA: response regulator [Candidatus Gastranaerophilales bacterium]|nr:response regulator [Candidatus Gastranaerophilales bacterium]
MNNKYTILVVDDEKDNLQLFMRTLRKDYNVLFANRGLEGLEILKNNEVDMIISDHKMPEMEGTEFLKKAYEIKPESVRMLVTAFADSEILREAINAGKVQRYLKKPWTPNDLLNVVEACFEVYQLNIDNQKLAEDLKNLFSGTISAIMEALDAKDPFTSGRSKRVTFYALKIGEAYGLSDERLSELEIAGLLHDIGMIGVPVNVITKPGNLTDEEYELIKSHTIMAMKILVEIKQLNHVVKIVGCHHEHYNGEGYPYGLKGEEIPVESQIIAIADAYDGLTSERAYRKSLAHEEAVRKIKSAAGSQFNPTVIEAFSKAIDKAKEEIINFDFKNLDISNNIDDSIEIKVDLSDLSDTKFPE